ncbi:MAG TPA: PLP-dependent aminotransferase family protein [Chloroflexota bacterium]|nr:PLP-dependent aminotransferase family protein [Chloroflexota bacterium]
MSYYEGAIPSSLAAQSSPVMPKRTAVLQLATITLDRSTTAPLYRQVYDSLRGSILAGQLKPGARLPSTRDLSLELRCSRNTVTNAFEQLLAEGYLEGKVGAGTYVTRTLPDDLLLARAARRDGPVPKQRRDERRHVDVSPGTVNVPTRSAAEAGKATAIPGTTRNDSLAALRLGGRALSRRGEMLATSPVTFPRNLGAPRAFRSGTPALEAFPADTWGRLVARQWRQSLSEMLGYGESAGYRPLREAIAAYLGAARAVRCDPDQVIVIAGAQQGLDLAARLLMDPGEPVLVEDPGYIGTRGALLGAGARVVPVPLDAEGLDIAEGERRSSAARLVYVTPSHQYPLGVTMSLGRRLALLEWAHRVGGWILEDDYDSEFRYSGRPLASLQGLDAPDPPATGGRVIYLGTFSKVLFPSLRLGYLVVPPDLVEAFTVARALASRHPPSLEQAVLADFIAEGHFATHIRRMRALYAERRNALLDEVHTHLSGLVEPGPSEAGMQLVVHLPTTMDDADVARRALARDVETAPLSRYAIEPLPRGGLLLGYACVSPEHIKEGVEGLASVLLDQPT